MAQVDHGGGESEKRSGQKPDATRQPRAGQPGDEHRHPSRNRGQQASGQHRIGRAAGQHAGIGCPLLHPHRRHHQIHGQRGVDEGLGGKRAFARHARGGIGFFVRVPARRESPGRAGEIEHEGEGRQRP
jgi:hypothetical protein